MQKLSLNRHKLFIAISAASLSFVANGTLAQIETEQSTPVAPVIDAPVLEEMLVTGRQQSGAQSLIQERMEDAFAAELMGSDQITRTGDTTVAAALTRVTGVTLNQGKYVYVRGLGERYASVQLNGAQVPSPELTRNVLPLDIIPASIVDSLKIQKAYSPDLPGHYGGGNVDIRTKSVPDKFVFDLTLGTGTNTNNGNDDLSYSGGGKTSGLPENIDNALDTYQGRIDIDGIRRILSTEVDNSVTPEQAQESILINRDLALSINRDIGIKKDKASPDQNGAVALGNSWDISDDWALGGILNWSQKTEWRNKDQETKGVGSPDTTYSSIKRSTEDTKELASVGVGIKFQDLHHLEASYMKIGNETDEAAMTYAHDSNNNLADGNQRVTYQTRFQDREMEVTQALGKHSFDQLTNSTRGTIDFDWFYSDSAVKTNIPGASTIAGDNTVDPATGEVLSTRIAANSSAQFAYLKLQDDVRSYGWNAKLPLTYDNAELTFSGGYSYNDKSREYYGYTALIDVGGGDYLLGTPGDVFTDSNINNLDNAFELTMSRGFGTESYIAGQITDAFYGMFDANFNDVWRFTAGARYEDYRTAVLPVDLLDYTGITIQKLIEDLAKEDQNYASQDDGWLPSAALTFFNDGFMGSESFQLRLSYAQTVVRPDLRELSDVIYIDPELNMRVQGNPSLVISTLDHFDLRGEWYFDGGNNLTATLFYKDITDPIEQKLNPGSDTDIVMGFYNAVSGEVYGVELEGLLNLDYGLFLSGNLTLSDSEIVSPEDQGFTNATRQMTGQSPYVLNMQLGYDSDNGKHGAALSYNIADEKVYFAALETGHDDAFEQPFSSLDFTYSYYPTEQLTFKAKLRNLLDEDREISQTNSAGKNVTILTQEVGTSMSLDISYSF
ncbi:MAG: TonB-dependent receptor [Cellvibrio sp.]|jgi:TonB-dependent receptor|nr:TonB-dependent receptor [Cellvibrio sp.]